MIKKEPLGIISSLELQCILNEMEPNEIINVLVTESFDNTYLILEYKTKENKLTEYNLNCNPKTRLNPLIPCKCCERFFITSHGSKYCNSCSKLSKQKREIIRQNIKDRIIEKQTLISEH